EPESTVEGGGFGGGGMWGTPEQRGGAPAGRRAPRQPAGTQRIGHRPAHVAQERPARRPDTPQRAQEIARPMDRQLDAGPARPPEHRREAIEPAPQAPMRRRGPEGPPAFPVPGGRIAMERHNAIGKPGDVTGQRLAFQVRQAEAREQFSADAARLEIDERGGADVEGEAMAAEEAGAAAGLAVRLEDDGG